MPALRAGKSHQAVSFHLRGIHVLVLLSVVLLGWPALAQTLVSITVKQVYNISGSRDLSVGDVRQFTATGTYSDGSTQYLTQTVTWTSSNTAVATVSSNMGLVTAVTPGKANIQATLSGVTGASSLTVVADVLTGVVISPSAWSMQAGTTQQYYATAEFGPDVIQDVTSAATWNTSNPAVATVTSAGLVAAVGTGTATISASYSTSQGSTTLTVTSAAPSLGLWSAPQNLSMTAIHMVLLNTGNVVVFSYPLGKPKDAPSRARLYNPTTNTVTDVTLPFPIDIFCAGQSPLPDGRLLVSGGLDDNVPPGDDGTFNTTIFDPSTNTWSQAAPMNYARWYPTTVTMPDGTILTAAGTAQDGVTIQVVMETYNLKQNTWAALPPSANMPTPNSDYPLLTVLPNGNLLNSGPTGLTTDLSTYLYNPTTKSWSFLGNLNWGTRIHAGAAILPKSQKVMIVAGGQLVHGGLIPTNTTEVVDFSQPNPQWVYGAPLNIARYNHNLIFLADGTLLAVGGNQVGHYNSPVEQPELYNPTTNSWSLLPPQLAVRGYHSTAVLLPDGRVLSAGSDSEVALQNTYEIYSPAYLFNGPRPTITSAPSSVTYSQQFTIVTPDVKTIKRVALIRPGTTTHAVHMDDQRYVDLQWKPGAGQITAIAPASGNDAPPGYYMLVIVNSNGVPSVMPFIQVLPKGW